MGGELDKVEAFALGLLLYLRLPEAQQRLIEMAAGSVMSKGIGGAAARLTLAKLLYGEGHDRGSEGTSTPPGS